MTKKIVKLAVIRDDGNDPCPFGLPIPFGCKYAGNVIERMAPLDILKEANDRDKKKISAANTRLLSWALVDSTYEPTRCTYAAKIFEKQEAVECNYGDTAPGEGQGEAIVRSPPFYSQLFSGIGMHGLYSYPVGYYADYDISRNLWQGQWSIHSEEEEAEIIKEAEPANKKS